MTNNNQKDTPMPPHQFRQGDVLIRRVPTIPAGLTPVPRDQGRVVLAYGEITGHAHAIADPAVQMLAHDIQDITRAFLVVEAEHAIPLWHEEHDTINLPGTGGQADKVFYEVRRQREYQPEAPVWVAD